MSNFSQVVSYARQTVGVNADLFLYHTAMMPRFNPISGSMDKEYLGKAVFIRQLNAAGMQAATALGMEVRSLLITVFIHDVFSGFLTACCCGCVVRLWTTLPWRAGSSRGRRTCMTRYILDPKLVLR